MKPHPRIRKTIKWGGAAASILLATIWAASCFCQIAYLPTPGCAYGMSAGCIYRNQAPAFYRGSAKLTSGWHVGSQPLWPIWWFSSEVWPSSSSIIIPTWPIVLAVASATLTAWRLDRLARRRAALNVCPSCGYDRTGIAMQAECPECGASPATSA